MKRLVLLTAVIVGMSLSCAPVREEESADYAEFDIAQLQAEMESGALTAVQLVDYYLQRIESIDHSGPELRSIIEINPDARSIAEALDQERDENGPRGPLHGIPVVLKANIGTGDAMATSAGSLALADHHVASDAFHVARLREAGAVVLAKTNLSEWANFRSTRSSSGWSSIGGQTRNAYDPGRNPCGSSAGSGVAVSANLAVLAVGTETDGSVMCPSGINGIVGIKPTLGLVSRGGIIPLAHSQDTAGPMARTVRDAATMLTVMSAVDRADPAAEDRSDTLVDYAANLSDDALQGKRIGVLRSYFGAGSNPYLDQLFEDAIQTLRDRGAVIVDSIEIETDGMGDAEYEVLLYEFKADLNAYLAATDAPFKTMTEIMAFNTEHADRVMPFFGQEIMELAVEKGPLTDQAYLDALATSKRISRSGIDDALAKHDLVALVAPTNGPTWPTDHVNGDHYSVSSSSYAAVSGYANITVPAGFVFDLPVGISFIGTAYSEETLIQLAYAYEQATLHRRPPGL
ncbi:MAG: amidase [Acidobacteriota bacterium]|nr:amidase [Acidobacteriota bacterium]MDH3785008.1 amidase [Acidobacteriota bacterium]